MAGTNRRKDYSKQKLFQPTYGHDSIVLRQDTEKCEVWPIVLCVHGYIQHNSTQKKFSVCNRLIHCLKQLLISRFSYVS